MYHETEGLDAWSTRANIGRCSDRVYEEKGGFSSRDGVLDVEFMLPSSLGEKAAGKEIVLDLEVCEITPVCLCLCVSVFAGEGRWE